MNLLVLSLTKRIIFVLILDYMMLPLYVLIVFLLVKIIKTEGEKQMFKSFPY